MTCATAMDCLGASLSASSQGAVSVVGKDIPVAEGWRGCLVVTYSMPRLSDQLQLKGYKEYSVILNKMPGGMKVGDSSAAQLQQIGQWAGWLTMVSCRVWMQPKR